MCVRVCVVTLCRQMNMWSTVLISSECVILWSSLFPTKMPALILVMVWGVRVWSVSLVMVWRGRRVRTRALMKVWLTVLCSILTPLHHFYTVTLGDVKDIADPMNKVKAGLQAEGADVPLQSVHVRAQLIDLAARVVVLQAYKNNSAVPIEAKYVFPLDDMAAGEWMNYCRFTLRTYLLGYWLIKLERSELY